MVSDDFCYSLRVPTALMVGASVSGLPTELVVTVVGMWGNVASVIHFDGIEHAANFQAMTQRRFGKKWRKMPLGALYLLLRTPSGTKKVTYSTTTTRHCFEQFIHIHAGWSSSLFLKFSYAPASHFRIFKVFNSWNFRSQYHRCSPP